FLAEAVDLIERVRDSFGGYPGATDQPDRLADVLRALHTLKGGASMFDMQALMRDSHSLEEALLPFKEKPARINAKVITKILKFVDRLENYLTQDPAPAKEPAPQAAEASPTEPAQEPAAHPTSRANHEMIRIGLDRVQKNLDVV